MVGLIIDFVLDILDGNPTSGIYGRGYCGSPKTYRETTARSLSAYQIDEDTPIMVENTSLNPDGLY